MTRTSEQPQVDCGIIVVSYNSADHLPGLISSIPAAAPATSVQLIVVDNGSTDASIEIAESMGATVVRSSNRGYAGGINEGRRMLGRCQHILILNPDLSLEPGAIDRLRSAFDVTPSPGAVVPRLVDSNGATDRSLRRDPTLLRAVGDALFGDVVRPRPAWSSEQVDDEDAYTHRHEVDWATGAAMMISQDCDRHVGDWDESYFMYSEEVEHAARIRESGYRIDFVPDAVAMHVGGGSGTNRHLVALLALSRVRWYRSRHGRLLSAVYRLVVVIHEASRCWSSDRRYSAAVVLGVLPPPSFDGARPIERVPW